MIHEILKSTIEKKRCTLLGVGAVTLNCVDATIELANQLDIPLMLIASRRQIDSDKFGGGYVNNWTTEQFSNYVRLHDKNEKVLLSRDHGGPWQNLKELESCLTLTQAMDSAKSSYFADISAGFKVIHIDPSVEICGKVKIETVLDRAFELYEYCWEESQNLKNEIVFEVGTEEHGEHSVSNDELFFSLDRIQKFTRKNRIPMPTFVVVQTGTCVKETRNIGPRNLQTKGDMKEKIGICERFGVMLKQHNTDYLSDSVLCHYPDMGIHAANVAPEFGVTESRALVNILEQYGMFDLANAFLDLAFKSEKWKKWMLGNSQASARERAIIAGHYVFSLPEFLDIKKAADLELQRKNIDLDSFLKYSVKQSIVRYIKNFNLVSEI